MCDYSLQAYQSRPAKVGDKLTVRPFGSGTSGFCSDEAPDVAVCLLPGTEIALETIDDFASQFGVTGTTAIFRQINKDYAMMHHDAVEHPNGDYTLVTSLPMGQKATVLQMPAAPKTEQEEKDQERLAIAG